MTHKAQSEYLVWVKTRTPGQYNLASSGIVPYSIAGLAARVEDIELRGPTLYGYPPLQAAIAAHCGVHTDSVVASSGTSMANFLALAALIEPGDEVLVEEPAYEPLLAAVKFFRGSIGFRETESGDRGISKFYSCLVTVPASGRCSVQLLARKSAFQLRHLPLRRRRI